VTDVAPVPLDGVVFDVDDTLVDTRRAFVAALAVVARTYLPHLSPDRHREVVAAWRADTAGHYRRYTRGEVPYPVQRMARANELHAAFGGPVLDDAGFQQWDALFERAFSGAWAALPGASRTVDTLLAAGLRVGALTNAAVAYQRTKLARAGMAERVPLLVGVDTLGVGKPDPRVFHEACRRLGTTPERTAYVGDELDIDARAAIAVGMVGVWFDPPGERRVEIPPTAIAAGLAAGVRVATSLDEVPALLGLGPVLADGRPLH